FGACGSGGGLCKGCNASAQQTCKGGVCCSEYGAYCDFNGINNCCGGGGPCVPKPGSQPQPGSTNTGICGCGAAGLPCTSDSTGSHVTGYAVACCSGNCDSGFSCTCT